MAVRVADLLVILSGDTKGFENAMQRVAQNTQQLGAKMQNIGQQLSLKLSLPLAAVGAASVKMAADFDDSLNRMVSLVGVARDQVNAWRGDIRDTAKATGQSAGELAEAMFFITSAGAQGKTAMDILKASAQAAKVGLGETKEVAFAAVSAVNAYGEANLSAEQAVATLVNTVKLGNLEAATLAPTLGRVIPIAAELGMSFDQVGGAYAAMTRLGASAEDAATSLNATLMTLLKPSKQAEETLQELGISFGDLREQLKEKGLLSVLDTLRGALANNEKGFAAVFENSRAVRGVFNLMGKNVDNTRKIFDDMAKTTGDDLVRAANEAEVSYRVRLNKSVSMVKDSFLELGERVLPLVVPLFEKIAKGVETVTTVLGNMSPVTKGFLAFFATLGIVGPPIIVLLGTFVKAMGTLKVAMAQYTQATAAATMATNGFTISSARAAASSGVLTGALNATKAGAAGLKGMLGAGGVLGVLIALIPLAYDLGQAMAGMFDKAKAPADEFGEELAKNGALFAMTIDQLELQKKKLGLVGDEWVINTEHTKENAQALSEMHTKLQKLIQERVKQRDTLKQVNEQQSEEQERMDRVKDALLRQKKQIDDTTEALREKYNVVTRQDVLNAIAQQVKDYQEMKKLGIDLGEGAGDFGEQLKANLEVAKRYKIPWEQMGEGVKEMSKELAEKQVPGMQKLTEEIGSLGPAYEQMMPQLTGAMTGMTDALTGELIALPDKLGKAAADGATKIETELKGGFGRSVVQGEEDIRTMFDTMARYAKEHPLEWPVRPYRDDGPPQGGDLP